MRIFSAILMIMSGVALTLASAWFGINGLLIFFPEKELYYGVLFLGIALEVAKIFTAVFLFHYFKDTHMPKIIKVYMGIGVCVLIFISAIATYVHLSYYVADYIKQEDKNTSVILRLNSELENNRKERTLLDKQIAELPSDYVTGRVSLMNKFDRRKKQIDAREEQILNKLNSLETKKIDEAPKSKEYAFLDYMSNSFGKSRQTIYNSLILLLVMVLDPLAIFLTLSGTFILSNKPLPINDIQEIENIKTEEIIIIPKNDIEIKPKIENNIIINKEENINVPVEEIIDNDSSTLVFKNGSYQHRHLHK